MARFEFRLPDIGEGVAEGEITEWHVKAGDVVTEDQPMVEVMTDKATVTIGAPKAGKIAELGGKAGQVIKVGQVLCVIETGTGAGAGAGAGTGTGTATGTGAGTGAGSGPAATAVGDIKESLPGSAFFAKKAPAPAAVVHAGNGNGAGHAAPAIEYFAEKPLATPATRKLARDLAIDLRKVKPTGPNGRVTKDDVRTFAGAGGAAHMHEGVAAQISPPPTAQARQPVAIRAPAADGPSHGGPLEERKPFVGIRRRIAERMQTAKNTAAHFTFVEECDVGRLSDLRARLKGRAEEAGVKLTFLPFIAKAVVQALKKHPTLNTALDETTNELVYRRYYHLGIAAATDAGLMVPVVKNADRLSILEIAREIDRLGNGARAGTLKPDELQGSTFTITSLGKQGGLFATPILNLPEVGILGVHQIKQKPVVKDGQIVIGEVMLLSLSFDHRIVDGHVGAAFAYEIIAYLEDPDRLLLEMS